MTEALNRGMSTRWRVCGLLALLACAAVPAAQAASITATGDYVIDPIYPTQVPDIGPVGVATAGTTLAALAGHQVETVALPGKTPSAPLFTLPPTVAGLPTFVGGFVVAAGGHILTGQTAQIFSSVVPGEAYLTPLAGGPTATRTINGIYDAAPRGTSFVVDAAHGVDSHGASPGTYGGFLGSGIYALEITGNDISGLDLLFDTGTFSGALATDPLTGDIYFALGGDSATLNGPNAVFNSIWCLRAADVAAAAGPGVIAPASADYIATISDGYISGFAFDPAGRLLVGLTNFTPGWLDRIDRYDVDRANAADYAGARVGSVAQATDPGVHIFDFDLDGATLRISAVPEPVTGVLMLAPLLFVRRRKSSHRRK